ncbi:hypothetical protein PRZ48_006680 [Zasmidium cellare]|uniref:Uncharacterized protein n=1 Tax=Zasmidium cellare TaxID=395010 RepID=A0ABR0ENS2_ZASCE|nr:hypothetical protein PRZ48_006680 [Zasmidium cellare]
MLRRELPSRPAVKTLKRTHEVAIEDEEEFNGFSDDEPVESNNPREKRLKQEDDEAVDSMAAEEDGGDDGDGGLQSSEFTDEIGEVKHENTPEVEEDNGDTPKVSEREPEVNLEELDIPDNESCDQPGGYYSGTEASDSDGDETVIAAQDEEDEEDEDDLPAMSAIHTTAEISAEDADVDTIARFWAGSWPDVFLPRALHPRGDSVLPLRFNAWGQRLKLELANLSRLVDSDTARQYIEEAYNDREDGQKWLIARDVREAVGMARDDGRTEREGFGA